MRRLLTTAVIGISLLGVACAESAQEPEEAPSAVTARFALTGDQCVEHENQDTLFPSNADRVVTRVSGFDDPSLEPIVQTISAGSQNAAGEVTVEFLPEGDKLVLEMVACAGEQTTWTGVSQGLSVEIGQETYVDVFLTPVDEVACIAEPGDADQLPSPHMFAASAPADERSVWLIGGFASYDDDPGERRLDAGNWVSVYDVPTASVSAFAQLQAPRAMAAATQLTDGRTLVAGGTSSIRIKALGQPPVWPGLTGAPTPSVEILTPGSGGTVSGPDVELADLPACAGTSRGKIVCVGGLDKSSALSKNAWVIGLTDVTTFEFPDGRYGAAVVSSQDGSGALVWGGHIGAPSSNAAVWISVEDPPSVQPLALSPAPAGDAEVPLFASGVALPVAEGDLPRFLLVGGSDAADGTLPHSLTAQTPRATLLEVNPVSGTAKIVALDLGELEDALETGDNIRRFGSQIAPLGPNRFWLMGGATSFEWDVACETDNPCFQRDSVVFELDSTVPGDLSDFTLVEQRSFDLDLGPFGMTGVSLYDGSWLVLGGMQSVTEKPFISRDAALVRHGSALNDLCSLELNQGP